MFQRDFAGRGQGGGTGLGFRGSSPPWPYIGRGRGGLPRCGYYTGRRADTPAPEATREQEISSLKGRAESIKKELDIVEARLRDLEDAGKELKR